MARFSRDATVRSLTHSPPRIGHHDGVEPFSIETVVPGGLDAARRARGVVSRELAGRLSPQVLGDVTLLVSELIANGVRHGGAGAGSALRMTLEGAPDAVRVEVADPGPRAQLVPARADGHRNGGMGLRIVDRLATRWGVGDGPHTSVWFELNCR
jgi:anti-sigma regulatory factor (Ser/Thr protein kinase)